MKSRVLLALFATLPGVPLHAATSPAEDAITRCAGHAVKDARIICLEDAMRRIASEGVAALPPAVADTAVPEPLPAMTAPPRDPAPEPDPAPQQIASAGAKGGEPTARAAEPAPAAEASARPDGSELGAEQVARRSESRNDPEAPMRASVVAVDVVGYQRLVVELDNGQVWRQTNGDRSNLLRELRSQRGFDVELRRTGLGGYRMYIVPLDRTVRVERLK